MSGGLGSRVPLEKVIGMVSAYQAGTSITAICEMFGSDNRTVNAVLARYNADDPTLHAAAAKQLLAAGALQAVADWQEASRNGARLGKHAPARDLLLHTGVIEPLKSDTGPQGVTVVIGIQGAPAGDDPLGRAITVHAAQANDAK